MKLIVMHFFLADILFLGVILDLDKYIFPWQTCFFLGLHLRLQSSYIWVNMVHQMSCMWTNMIHTWFKAHVNHAISLIQYNVGALV